MMSRQHSFVAGTGLLFLACACLGDPVRWPVSEGGNGHWYEAVPVEGPITWSAAKAAAESRTYLGAQGHLATITSQAENDFVVSTFQNELIEPGVIMGGYEEPEGTWRWVTGESWDYSNWYPGEPSNFWSEQYLVMWWYATSPAHEFWNDTPDEWGFGAYFVEYPVIVTEAAIDIKPGDCTNKVTVPRKNRSSVRIVVAIVGSAAVDVTTVDPASVTLESVAPVHITLEDSATPDCGVAGPDGLPDLVFHFPADAILDHLGLGEDATVALMLSGLLREECGGSPIEGIQPATFSFVAKP